MPLSDFFGGVQRFAGQALGQAQQGYRQLDKSLGGWLPGGGTASPASPAIRKFAGDVREKAIVPAIDVGMQQGIIPGDVGMFGRFLTGTRQPLTRMPKDVRSAEATYAQTVADPKNYILEHNVGFQQPSDIATKEHPLANTLGRYVKKEGVITDRYDFNSYLEPGSLFLSIPAGELGNNQQLTDTITTAGRLADRLGFIKPGSGYDVRFDTNNQ